MAALLTDSELLLLGLLAEAPRTGSEIEELVESRGIRNWTRIGNSSIYYLLATLEKQGLIKQVATITGGKGKAKRVFGTTSKGIDAAVSSTLDTLRVVESVPSPVLVGIANLPLIGPDEALRALTDRLEALHERAATIDASRAEVDRPAFVTALFTHGIFQLRAEIDWVTATIDDLSKETAMAKIDFRKASPELYAPSAKEFTRITVSELRYLMIDGRGNPNTAQAYKDALEALYPASYAIKFASKNHGRDYTVGPLEGLWWAEDGRDFRELSKDEWNWTLMIRQPEWMEADAITEILEATAAKKMLPLIAQLRFESLDEGDCVQIMHHGPYDDEAATLAKLHDEYIPGNGLEPNGRHHEIYLSDPRRTSPERLRTVLRQPVRAG